MFAKVRSDSQANIYNVLQSLSIGQGGRWKPVRRFTFCVGHVALEDGKSFNRCLAVTRSLAPAVAGFPRVRPALRRACLDPLQRACDRKPSRPDQAVATALSTVLVSALECRLRVLPFAPDPPGVGGFGPDHRQALMLVVLPGAFPSFPWEGLRPEMILTHQTGDPMAATGHAVARQFGVNARTAIPLAALLVCRPNLSQ
jgi:hypothetical protein